MTLNDLRPQRTDKLVYHHGQKKKRGLPLEERPFIAWDGEGVNLHGANRPQDYLLFGSSEDHISNPFGLDTFELLDHIIETGRRNPWAVHIGFAFGYDTNMIVRSLAPLTLRRLHKRGWVRLKDKIGRRYTVTYRKGKYFRVTRLLPSYDSEHNSTAKTTVTIFDIFSFFASSFIKAYEKWVGPAPRVVVEGKAKRKYFTIDDFHSGLIERYWTIEIDMLRELAEALRTAVYGAGLRITQWHGPGALASYVMKSHGVKNHMRRTPEELRLPVRIGYAAGRFELFHVGRFTGRIYGVDLNSAYPYAMTLLPSMVEGEWEYESGPTGRIKTFGLYHIRLRSGGPFELAASPLFHRDKDHNISFPWHTDGWYWGPEAKWAVRKGGRVLEAWVYHAGDTRPFEYLHEMYDQRRIWKEVGNAAERAFKLGMNSHYGKAAQREGWNEEFGRLPPFHQLEWAGWVTSFTRASLYELMERIPRDKLIAVETDGIYTTETPEALGIKASDALGGWSVDEYDEVMYVQSGLAWLHNGDGWTPKRRGLDEDTFTLEQCREFLGTLHAKPNKESPWPDFVGSTTRFVGMGQALASSAPVKSRHCVWVQDKREISVAQHGKRIHIHGRCTACKNGYDAYEQPHALSIHSLSSVDIHSYPHSIPWEDEEGHARWREQQEAENDYEVYV